MLSHDNHRTICAIATPPGVGGISVIRVSGPESIAVVHKIARFLPDQPQSRLAYYGTLVGPHGTELDECLVTSFASRQSFTGEPSVEISCHGNPLICRQILEALVDSGARLARPGEFTFRAFMNGRVDLVQAESVHTLVQSRSELEKQNSLRQLHGGLSEDLLKVEKGLTHLLAHIEADIDFSTENPWSVDRLPVA
jgi:tRNA modification GTPase